MYPDIRVSLFYLAHVSWFLGFLRNQLTDSLASILLSDELLRVLELDSASQTLRFLGAPVEPIFDTPTETLFLRNAFAFIVNCIRAYFEH